MNDAPGPSRATFSSLGLAPFLLRSLSSLRITAPTPIQTACIPAVLSGRDVVGGAQTGSGKTLAFAAPILQSLSKEMVGGYAVVLTPTRELAQQLHEQFLALGASINLRAALVVGGLDMMRQAAELAQSRPHIIIATPGRLVDHMRSGGSQEWGLSRCRFVVLDEADRLLSSSFAPELAYLFEQLPPPQERQTLLFTATLTPSIHALVERPPPEGKQKPVVCQIEASTTTPSTLRQQYIFVPSHVREPFLFHLLHNPPFRPTRVVKRASSSDHRKKQSANKRQRRKPDSDSSDDEEDSDTTVPSTIIFAARCRTAELLCRMLHELDLSVTALHSHMSQPARLASLDTFRAHRATILVTTDVGSRGLDIPEVEMVVNWDLPAAPEDYVHRVGRTARAGRQGWAVSFVTERDVELVKGIEEKINVTMTELEMPEETVLEKLNAVSTAKRVANMALHDEKFGERQERNRQKAQLAMQAATKGTKGDTKSKSRSKSSKGGSGSSSSKLNKTNKSGGGAVAAGEA